jgi:hypothetical protein
MLKNVTIEEAALTEKAREYAFPEMSAEFRATNLRLAPTAAERWPFDRVALLDAAVEKTGLYDFGPDYFVGALDMLCRSAEEDLDLNPVGRRNLWFQILDHLTQRLRFVDLWTRQPEILDEPIEKPIFIVGLPRSGTTFLQQLLALDKEMRVTPFWEQLGPLPDHDAAIRPPDDAPMIERARRDIEGLQNHAPGLLAMHQLAVDAPEEEIYLLGPAFASMVYEWVYILPQFADWYAKADHTEGYRFFRQILQALQWMRGGGRWLLKAPQHMEQIKPLMAVFPDALFVETLRDPVTAAISNASLSGYGQRIRTDHPNPHAAGQSCMVIIERLVSSLLADQPHDDPRFLPVHFAALMADPLCEVRRVFDAAGMALTPETEARMAAYVEANSQSGHNGNSYAPEDFAIDVQGLRSRIAGYYERFGVKPDLRFS